MYLRGQYFHATLPTDRATWQTAGRPIALEDKYLFNNTTIGLGFFVFNLTGREIIAAVDSSEEISNKYGNTRWNEKELDAVPVGRGQSVYFPTDPTCYVVSFSNYRISENGRTFEESDVGIPLHKLVNTTITVQEGVYSGTVRVTYGSSIQQNYTVIKNATKEEITCYISRVVYDGCDDKSAPQKIDTGPRVVEEKVLDPDGEWNLRVPIPYYNVRCLQPNRPSVDDKRKRGSLASIEVPNNIDYVQLALTQVQQAFVAVFFSVPDGNGAVEGISLPLSQCIRVSDRLTSQVRNR